MYIEPLFPVAECVVVAGACMMALVSKYVEHKRYVRQYPYKVQRYLRTDRVVYNWNNTLPTYDKPTRTIPIVKGAHINGVYHETVYIKEKDLYR